MELLQEKERFANNNMFPKSIIKNGVLESPIPGTEPKELETSFAELFISKVEEDLKTNGDRPAMINGDLDLEGLEEDDLSRRQLFLSEIVPLARKFGKVFHHLGLGEGDVVHLSLPNVTEFPPMLMGIWLCGGIASIVDPDLHEKACADQILDTKPTIIVCHEGNRLALLKGLERNGSRLHEAKVVLFNRKSRKNPNATYLWDIMENVKDLEEPPKREIPDPDAMNMLMWSSGTTSRSKGVIKINRAFLPKLEKISISGVNKETRSCCTSAFFHGSGLSQAMSCCYSNFTSVFISAKNVINILRIISKHKCSVLGTGGGPFTAISRLTKEQIPDELDLSSLRVAWPAGTSVPKNSYELMKNIFPNLEYIMNVYAMSEFGLFVSLSKSLDNLGNVGPGVKARIVDPDTGKILGPNKTGEIQCHCAFMSPGYYGRPEETAKMYTEDNFYRTGDLGHYDEEGCLYFDGRLKELIKSGPKQAHVYPSEIENALLQHPDIVDAGVFGKMDEKTWTEVICGVIQRNPKSKLTEADIMDYMKTCGLEDYQLLHGGVVFVDFVPRNPVGKLSRRLLQEYFERNK